MSEPIDLGMKKYHRDEYRDWCDQTGPGADYDLVPALDMIEDLRSDLKFCMDTAYETPEIHKSNRVGKALSDIYNRCASALSG